MRWATHSENSQNTGLRADNKSGHKNLSYHKRDDAWRFRKMIGGEKHDKTGFKTIEEAIAYRDQYLLKLDNEFVRIDR